MQENKELRGVAMNLYHPPFRYENGYVFDSTGQMVSDDEAEADAVQRVRGWGRISYLKDPGAVQDTVGHLIAEALTQFWENEAKKRTPIGVPLS